MTTTLRRTTPSLNTEYYIDSSTYHPSRPSACMRRYGRWLGRYCPLQSEYWTRGALDVNPRECTSTVHTCHKEGKGGKG